MQTPFISILIPCRNEEKFIEKCLRSIIANDYPKKNLEILVIDGQSNDKTKDIIQKIQPKYAFIKLLENTGKITSTGLNIGIKHAKGKIIMRMDAHTTYPTDYISKCINNLIKDKADNVGGVIKTQPSSSTIISRSIAFALACKFGIGNSKFRTGVKKPQEADTIPFGCYRREVFDKIGLFNENLKRSQDMEFNLRLKLAGGKILLCPDIISYYYARSTLKKFIKHNFSNGIWATYPLKFVKIPLKIRHYTPLLFVCILILTIAGSLFFKPLLILFILISAPYVILNLYFSTQIAFNQKNSLYLFTMPLIFATLHISYGIGSIIGLFKILLPAKSHKLCRCAKIKNLKGIYYIWNLFWY